MYIVTIIRTSQENRSKTEKDSKAQKVKKNFFYSKVKNLNI